MHKHLGLVLLIIPILVAVVSFDEYGIQFDETQQVKTGKLTYDYVFSDDNSLLEWRDRDYGIAFDLSLTIIEKALNLSDSRDVYLMRHLL